MSSIWTGILHIKVLDEQLPREAVTTLEVTSKHMYNQLYRRLRCNWGLEKKESVFWQGSLTGSQMQAPLFLLRMTSWDPHRPYTWKELQGSLCFLKVSVHIQILQFSSVQLLSCVIFFATPWTLACQASLSINNLQSPPKPMSIESVMPSNYLILCHLLLLLPSISPSIRVFSTESVLRIKWPKYWSFSFNISPSNKHPGLISFRMDWLDLLAVQGTLKSLLQHHSSKASVLWHSTFL